MAKGKAGRPPSITPEQQETLCRAISRGAFIETAITLAGVPKRTFYDWLKRAVEDEKAGVTDSVYMRLSKDVKKSLAEAEDKYVQIIGRAASDTWQAAAWMLERRFREKWARDKEQPKS